MLRQLFFVLLILLGASCTRTSDSCDDIDFSRFDRDQITLTGIAGITAFRRTSEDALQLLDQSSAVSVNSLELHVEMQYVSSPRSQAAATVNWWGWFVKTAHACSVAPYESDLASIVTDIDIISTESFDDSQTPGSSIAQHFNVERVEVEGIDYGDYFRPGNVQSLASFDATDSIDPTGFGQSAVKYVLTPAVSSGSTAESELHRFTVSVTLQSGEMFSADSEGVLIQAIPEPPG